MRLPRKRLLVSLGLTAAAAAAALGVAVWQDWWRDAPIIAADERISASAVVSPRSHMFGDPVTARLDLVFSRVFLPADTVRVRASFGPFRIESFRRERSDHGETTRLTYVYRLSCLTNACVAEGGQRTFEFPEARVSYRQPGFGDRRSEQVEWPSATAASRLDRRDLAQPTLRATLRPLPEITYRIAPGTVAALAVAGAVLMLLAATALLVPQLPRSLGLRIPAWARRSTRPLTPLERALERVRAAGSNGATNEERRALEQLALELANSGRSDLAYDARRLAWSAQRPAAAGIGDLSTEVARLVEAQR